MRNDLAKPILVLVYFITVILWLVFVARSGYVATYEGPDFEYILKPFLVGMTILPLLGGVFGLINARRWGGSGSVIGRALMGLSLGLVAWGGGMVIWNYYLFFTNVEVPYPSLADGIFILSWPLWAYGIFELSKATGVKFALRDLSGKIIAMIIPLVAAALSYYLLFNVARGGLEWEGYTLKSFFDIFYPIGDIVILTVTILVYALSKKFLGGIYKLPVLVLLIGFIMNYFSDFMFSYTTTQETYFNGHVVDLLFTTTMFVLSLAITMFDQRRLEK